VGLVAGVVFEQPILENVQVKIFLIEGLTSILKYAYLRLASKLYHR
jgi:hypothetical protein